MSLDSPSNDRALAVPASLAEGDAIRVEQAVLAPGTERQQPALQGHLLHLANRLERIESQLDDLLAETQSSGNHVATLTHHLTDIDTQRIVGERLADVTARLEHSQDRLDELTQNMTKFGRTQFKANTLAETKEQQVAAALATFQEIVTRREQIQQAHEIAGQQRLADLRAEARAELAADLLPALDGVELAIESGRSLFEQLRRQAADAARARSTEPAQPEGVIRRLRDTLSGRAPVVIVQALPEPIDNASKAVAAWLRGLELVQARFLSLLAAEGIQPISAQNQLFDPRLHVAVEIDPRADVAPDTVVKVLHKGYRQRERVIRYAEVVVSRAPAGQPTSSPAKS